MSVSLHNLARILKRFPWVVAAARVFWRLRQAKFTAGVVGVILDPRGNVLLVEHVFHPYAPWGLPGGWVDRRERPDQTLRRELREELSVEADVGPVLLVDLDFDNHLDFAYLCSIHGAIGPLSHELLDFRWCSPAELPSLQPFHYRAVEVALAQSRGLVSPTL